MPKRKIKRKYSVAISLFFEKKSPKFGIKNN
jgi:hypothetical protein